MSHPKLRSSFREMRHACVNFLSICSLTPPSLLIVAGFLFRLKSRSRNITRYNSILLFGILGLGLRQRIYNVFSCHLANWIHRILVATVVRVWGLPLASVWSNSWGGPFAPK